MSTEENAWKLDAEGHYIEMLVGERKDYSIDWTDFLEGAAFVGAAFTFPAGITQIGAAAVNGNVVQFVIEASGLVTASYACSHTLTFGVGNLKEILRFRVRVMA